MKELARKTDYRVQKRNKELKDMNKVAEPIILKIS